MRSPGPAPRRRAASRAGPAGRGCEAGPSGGPQRRLRHEGPEDRVDIAVHPDAAAAESPRLGDVCARVVEPREEHDRPRERSARLGVGIHSLRRWGPPAGEEVRNDRTQLPLLLDHRGGHPEVHQVHLGQPAILSRLPVDEPCDRGAVLGHEDVPRREVPVHEAGRNEPAAENLPKVPAQPLQRLFGTVKARATGDNGAKTRDREVDPAHEQVLVDPDHLHRFTVQRLDRSLGGGNDLGRVKALLDEPVSRGPVDPRLDEEPPAAVKPLSITCGMRFRQAPRPGSDPSELSTLSWSASDLSAGRLQDRFSSRTGSPPAGPSDATATSLEAPR